MVPTRPSKGSDADDDLKDDQAALKPDDFLPGSGLQRVFVFVLRQAEVLLRFKQQPADGRRMLFTSGVEGRSVQSRRGWLREPDEWRAG